MSDDLTIWTAREVADYLRCGRSTLYRHMQKPGFPAKINPGGGHPRWLAAQVKNWAVARERPQAA